MRRPELVARAEETGLLDREPAEDDQRVTYLRLTGEGERRLSGALLESDRFRRDLIHGFEELAQTFRRASRL
jgi:DNA-binding MarR family transcriptional regulator